MYYAQLNAENICFGISDLSGEVVTDNLIKLENVNVDLIGKKYENGQFVDVDPQEQPEAKQLTETEALMLGVAEVSEDVQSIKEALKDAGIIH